MEGKFAFRTRITRCRPIRGPTPSFPFGNVPDLYRPSFFQKLAKYGEDFQGDAFLIWIGLYPGIVISDPSHIKHVLITNEKNYTRGISQSISKIVN
jgi:hypothetical protein